MKAKKAPSASSLDECDGHLTTGHAEYREWCLFCVAGRIEAARDHRHVELHLDYAFICRETEDRSSPILVGTFPEDCEQTFVVKSDQEASIADVKNVLMRENSSVHG